MPKLLRTALLTLFALLITLTAACSPGSETTGEEPEAAPGQEAEATIIALATRIADMEADIEDRDRQIADLSSRRTAEPEKTPETENPLATPALTPPSDPTPETAAQLQAPPTPLLTPSTPGICARTPQIQEVLLEALDNTLCQNISEHELFRITSLPEISLHRARPGDFHGLTNLTELTLRITDTHLEPGALAGLENLLHATIHATGFTKGAISEIPTLRSLDLILLDPETPPTAEETAQSLPALQLPLLTTLRVGNLIELHHRTVGPEMLQELPSLRQLTLLTSPRAHKVRRIASLNLRSQLFAGNPKLTTLEIRQGNEQQLQTTLYEDTFQGNPLLTSITIHTHSLEAHPAAMANLHSLQVLQLHGQPEGSEPTLRLSARSPLQNRIHHGYESPVGYTLPEEES